MAVHVSANFRASEIVFVTYKHDLPDVAIFSFSNKLKNIENYLKQHS